LQHLVLDALVHLHFIASNVFSISLERVQPYVLAMEVSQKAYASVPSKHDGMELTPFQMQE
jgi:hypothetical protein